MTNILVTGGAGFIGTNFVYYWLDKYPADNIIVLDALTYAGIRGNLPETTVKTDNKYPGFQFVHGNILDQNLVEKLLTQYNINTIVHFAAESHVDRSITGPDEFINTNIVGTHTLLKAAKKIWLDKNSFDHHFHHISTDEVYGTLKPDDPLFSETTPYAPNSPYAASKASSDHLVRAYHETYGLKTTTSNCSNNFGPFQFPEKLIPLVITNILDGKPIPVYGDGMQIRDWLHVDDHNKGVDLILQKGKSGQTYNIGNHNEKTNMDIVKTICKLMDKKFGYNNGAMVKRFPKAPKAGGKSSETLITHVKDRLGHDRRYAIDPEKIKSELGYFPEKTFETGIEQTINWFVDNEKWWRRIIK